MDSGRSDSIIRIPPGSETYALALIGALSSTILLKVASIQFLELLELALLAYVFFRVLRSNLRIELSRGLFRITSGYFILVFLIMLGAGLAFTRPFYFDADRLNQPGLVTAARLLELVLGASAFVILAEVFRRSPSRCFFTAKIYFWIGTLSAFLSIAGIALRGPLSLFVTGRRASGFYNEGGPYGLYILSVILVGFVFTRLTAAKKPPFLRVGITLDVIALLLSASKAAYVAVLLLLLIQVLYAGGLRRKLLSFGFLLMLLIMVGTLTPANKAIGAYVEGGRKFETISQLRPNDVNFSYGRVAALFFVPRMIENHPWLGVGFGNYGLVRNAPEYRGNAAAATFLDHDGLGLAGVAAEIGLPGIALLIYLLAQPAVLARRLTHSKIVLALAFLQPVVHLCGAQLNVTYPWIASALALGMASMPEFNANSDTLRFAAIQPETKDYENRLHDLQPHTERDVCLNTHPLPS